MQSQKAELLALLAKECDKYTSIPACEQQAKREQKSFIDGLMTACRVVGISYQELSAVVERMPKQAKYKNLDELLSVPTYIRENVEIHLP
ncbi:hypothetical protein ACPV4B_16550 [Vibrio parahaemolyticus]|uniref:hypothetical protein n=1 Tax=Vibrio mediterranei TaxID=689 RepID=UPI0040692F38